MKITVLGSGTSSGVPVIGCTCKTCMSSNPKNTRLRSSCYIETEDLCFLIDTSPDLRQQALTHNIKHVDAVLFTHTHADHVHGIDELRIFNAMQHASIPVFGHQKHLENLMMMFSYIFNPSIAYPSLVPRLDANFRDDDFEFKGQKIQMVPCAHGVAGITYNYRIGNFAWLTDVNAIPPDSMRKLKGLDVLFIDGLRPTPHPTHFMLEQSLKAARDIAAKQTFLIHLAHDYDHDVDDDRLWRDHGVRLAYDGLVVQI